MPEPAQLHRIEELYYDALDVSEAERADFLARACVGEEALQHEVESLLAARGEAKGFLSAPAVRMDSEGLLITQRLPAALAPLAGSASQALSADLRLGNYRLLRELGSGGMGAVWLAERADEQFKQFVAIKLVKPAAGNDEIVRRFRHERQILAELDHPNIARLLDGGTTAEGQPYFVMEHIEGLPIDEYCRRQQLSVDERLKLFRQVCAALHYAHQNLVIHRDLKPGNILVTTDGTPKLLDFGIAKLLQPDLSQSFNTLSGVTPMTPAYASPEQVRGEKLTTASDVYSLGVVLYELLTGRSPYRLKANTMGELLRAVCEQEPERPSTAITRTDAGPEQAAAAITIEPASKLRRRLAGDIDSIVLMALRKEEPLRYGSVEQFSEDIWRYLEGLPTQARRGTFGYQVIKYIQRNKVPVAAAALVLLSLLAGIGTTLRQARIARAEQTQANVQRQRAETALATAEERRQQAEAARQEADQQRAEAEEQRTVAEAQRQRAEAQELSNRRLLYASQMKLAQTAWDESNVEQVRELLTAHIPKPGQPDLRGFEWHWLWRISHTEVATLPHRAPTSFIKFTADARRLLTFDVIPEPHDHLFRVWDTTSWQEKYKFGSLATEIGEVSVFSPDGSLVATTVEPGCGITVWETGPARKLGKWLPAECLIQELLFSPDGKRLAVFTTTKQTPPTTDGQIILLEPLTGQTQLSFRAKVGPPSSYVFSPDGKMIVTTALDNFLRFYDTSTGQERRAIERKERLLALGSSPTGRYLVLKFLGGQAVIWDTVTQQDVFSPRTVSATDFSPDGRYFAGVTNDRQIKVWETNNWQELASFKGHGNIITSLTFSPDGKRFATTSWDSTVKIWDLNVRQLPQTFSVDPAFASSLAFSLDSRKLYVQGFQPPVAGNYTLTKSWDIKTSSETSSVLRKNTTVTLSALSPDRQKIAYADTHLISVRNAVTGAELLNLKVPEDSFRSIAWSHKGQMIVTSGYSRSAKGFRSFVRIWDALAGRELHAQAASEGAFFQTKFLPNDKILVISGGVQLLFYDFANGRFIKRLSHQGGTPSAMELSLDGKKIALGFREGHIRLFDAITGEKLLDLRGHSRAINQMSFSTDSRRLATISGDLTARVWDLGKGQELLVFRELAQNAGIAFSPDGRHLAVGYPKGIVKVYSAADLTSPSSER